MPHDTPDFTYVLSGLLAVLDINGHKSFIILNKAVVVNGLCSTIYFVEHSWEAL